MNTVERLKSLQADAMAFYIKVHNYHWNVKGMQFYPVHQMTQGIYEKFAEVYDDCAERALQLGSKPFLTIGEIAANAKIKEESGDEFDAKYVLESIRADYNHFLGEFKELSRVADGVGDKATSAFADEKVAELEKDIWMLNQALK